MLGWKVLILTDNRIRALTGAQGLMNTTRLLEIFVSVSRKMRHFCTHRGQNLGPSKRDDTMAQARNRCSLKDFAKEEGNVALI